MLLSGPALPEIHRQTQRGGLALVPPPQEAKDV